LAEQYRRRRAATQAQVSGTSAQTTQALVLMKSFVLRRLPITRNNKRESRGKRDKRSVHNNTGTCKHAQKTRAQGLTNVTCLLSGPEGVAAAGRGRMKRKLRRRRGSGF
jgi:hypothetical protein